VIQGFESKLLMMEYKGYGEGFLREGGGL